MCEVCDMNMYFMKHGHPPSWSRPTKTAKVVLSQIPKVLKKTHDRCLPWDPITSDFIDHRRGFNDHPDTQNFRSLNCCFECADNTAYVLTAHYGVCWLQYKLI